MSEEHDFKDKWPQVDRILSQLKRLNELTELDRQSSELDEDDHLKGDARGMSTPKYCGYSNCFRPFYKMRGFMPCCKFHYQHPNKWCEDGRTYTGSVFIQKTEESKDGNVG